MIRTVIGTILVIAVLFLSGCMPIQDPAAMQDAAALQSAPMTIETADDVPRISLDEAKQHFDDGTALFVDARSAEDYELAHIAGALHMLPDAVDNSLPKDQLIITYCT